MSQITITPRSSCPLFLSPAPTYKLGSASQPGSSGHVHRQMTRYHPTDHQNHYPAASASTIDIPDSRPNDYSFASGNTVLPRNYLLFACHATNATAQLIQCGRWTQYWKFGGREQAKGLTATVSLCIRATSALARSEVNARRTVRRKEVQRLASSLMAVMDGLVQSSVAASNRSYIGVEAISVISSAEPFLLFSCLFTGRGCRFFCNSCGQEGFGEGQERLDGLLWEEARCIESCFVFEISYQFEIGLARPPSQRQCSTDRRVSPDL